MMLQSPVIAGSCGLTADAGKLREIEENGAGAVILKSVFEEQMRMGIFLFLKKLSRHWYIIKALVLYY